MRRSRWSVLSALCCAGALTLSGCGDDAAPDDAAAAVTTTAVAPAPTDQLTPDDDADPADDPATIDDICTVLTEEEVGAIVGATVTVEEQPGGGCAFDQEDPRAPTLAFATVDAGDDTDGTFNESRVGAFGVLTDPTVETPPVGAYAAVASGTIGGDNQQGAGLVQVGTTIVQVTLVQGNGLDGATVRSLTTGALELAASKL